MLTDFLNRGGIYAGASAGALIAGVDIAPVASIDEPEKVTNLTSTKGLGLVDIVPIPHYDMSDRTHKIDEVMAAYGKDYNMVKLTDDQAILVEGKDWKIVDSPRSALEIEWFKKNHLA